MRLQDTFEEKHARAELGGVLEQISQLPAVEYAFASSAHLQRLAPQYATVPIFRGIFTLIPVP